MSDILQRVENMLGDCAIGPMRTLKTDDLTHILYDAHEEIERLRASEAKLREALRRVRTAIVEADPSILTCTLWMPDTMSETVVDHIDAALEEGEKE